jgi:hypothetical protein
MKKTRCFLILLVAMGTCLIPSRLSAQQNGRVWGLIWDADFNPIPGAVVRLTNLSIGFAREQTTGADGIYTFVEVPPKPGYVLTVEAPGFEPGTSDEFELSVNQLYVEKPPITLERVQVQGAAQLPAQPKVESQATVAARPSQPAIPRRTEAITSLLDFSPMMSGVIDSYSVHTLPLADRDFLDLALLVPGTYPVEQGSPLAGASLVVNGVRANMNNFLLDGADDNDYTINQSLPFQLVEAMQEFRVQTSTSTAEFGRNAGAQINTVSRSGSNSFHGDLFEFNRNSALSALNALSLYRGGTFDGFAQYARVLGDLPSSSNVYPNPVLSDPVLNQIFQGGRELPLNQNQFGANLGGPIKTDKAYFFFNWESFRAANPRPVFERVPDMAARDATACASTDAAIYGGTSCAPTVVGLANLYPAPNVPMSHVSSQYNGSSTPVSNPSTGDSSLLSASNGYYVLGGAFYVGDSKNFTDSDNFLGRVDVQPTKQASMSFKHNVQDINQLQGGSLPATASYPGNGIDVNGRNQNFSYNYSQELSPAAVNLFRVAWNRLRLDTVPLDHTVDPSPFFQNLNSSKLGFPTVLIGGYEWTTGPYASLGAPFNAPDSRADNVWTLADNLTRTAGRHLVEMGFEFRRNLLNVNNDAAERGLVAFWNVPWAAYSGSPSFASIARVGPQFGGVDGAGGLDRSFSDIAYDWFVQDAWRPRQNLSINFGLRYEINNAPVEARNRLVNDYPGASPECGLFCLMQAGSFQIYNSLGSIVGTSKSPAPRAGFNTDYKDFGPRFGLTWSPGQNGKLVVRTGYALAFDQQSLEPSVNMLLNPPFVQQSADFFPSLAGTFQPGFPTEEQTPGPLGWYPAYSITARDPNTRSPYVHQFHFGIEGQLGTSGVLGIAYVGSAGHRLPSNRLLLGCAATVIYSNPSDCFSPAVAAFLSAESPGGYVAPGNSLDSIINQENSANSIYNSLQARFDTRSFHRLTVHGYYQWAHSIDDASSATAPVFIMSPPVADMASALWSAAGIPVNRDQLGALNSLVPTLSLRPELPTFTTSDLLPNDTMNSAKVAGQRASSDFDARQRFVISYIYDVPGWRRAGRVGGGWQLAGITTVQSGQPFSVFSDFFGVPLRPDQVGHTQINNRNPDGAVDEATPAGCNVTFGCSSASSTSSFNVFGSSFFMPGSLPRNTFTGPGLTSFDFSILKNTRISEGKNLQFRVEFFNVLNHANYLQPYSDAGESVLDTAFPIPKVMLPAASLRANPFFGEILQSRAPREIQFALKFTF